MNYHNITHDDMLNGDGIRVVLWVSGCDVRCKNCHNPETWEYDSGIEFDENAMIEIFDDLKKDYVSGITFTGGHPLAPNNLETVYKIIKTIKERFPNKTIWLYTGYTWEYLFPIVVTDDFDINRTYRESIVSLCDVVVDGPYIDELRDIKLSWRGSSNQRVIDVKKTLENKNIVLWCK